MLTRRALRTVTPALFMTASRCFTASTSSCSAPSSTVLKVASMTSVVAVPPETLSAIDGLEPPSLWSHFASLSSIPRPSKKEAAVLSYIKGIAESKGLTFTEDKVGNLCVFRPGSGGGEDALPVIVQGHVDMVTEKNDGTNHDFNTDPIRLRKIEGGSWVGAHGTTLGADNGIGVAAALALMTEGSPKPLPPLEFLFTVDEETGLTGAMDLDTDALQLTGRTLLNLDTEEWGDLYIGCAGGGHTEVTLPLQRSPVSTSASETRLVQLRVDGLMGGHSGINIHEGRANAVILCAATVKAAIEAVGHEGLSLINLRGGDKHNAIPREASALFYVKESSFEVVKTAIEKSQAGLVAEYGSFEKGLKIALSDASETEVMAPLDSPSTEKLLAMLLAIPVGPLKYSHVIPDLVETSNNLASVVCDEVKAKVMCSSRSSISSALEFTRDRVQAVAMLAGATAKKSDSYPGWNPNSNSPTLKIAKDLLRERVGREPGIKAIHAGLECGLLLEKLGEDPKTGEVADALSFGPTITGAHSPDERIDASTVPLFFELVQDILAELSKKKA